MAKKNTLRVNEIKPKTYPFYRYQVLVSGQMVGDKQFYDTVDVIANAVEADGDDLNFFNIGADDEDILVASFKEWRYFIRKDADFMRCTTEWGEKFEKLAKDESDLDEKSMD